MKRYLQYLTLSILTVLVSSCRLAKNFHTVEDGELYRSAQLTSKEFQMAIDELGIKTIINLRGAQEDENWYKEEVKVANKNDVTLIDIHMSASRLPHKRDLIKLLESFKDAPRPILIHCRAGADRTGEAAAIYAMEYMGQSKKKALKMFSTKYLHVEKFKPAKKYFIRAYEGIEWAYNEYEPCTMKVKYYDRNKYCNDNPLMLNAPLTEDEDT